MKLSAVAVSLLLSFVVSGASAQESAPKAGPQQIGPVKVGSRITSQFRRYIQADQFGPMVLEDKALTTTYVLESDDSDGRAFKYRNGITLLYGTDNSFVGSVSKDGERKVQTPESIKHWMPSTEIKPGMTWKYSVFRPVGTNGTSTCRFNETYSAKARPAERELSIAGVPTHIDAVEVDVDGTGHVEGACEGDYYYYKEVYVYSKALNLIIEYGYQGQDGYKKMVGGNANHVDVVTAIN
jgi:hypothetical protein